MTSCEYTVSYAAESVLNVHVDRYASDSEELHQVLGLSGTLPPSIATSLLVVPAAE